MVFFASHILSLTVILATFFIVGRKLTSRLQYPDISHEIAFSLTLGMGVVATMLFALGLAQQLNRTSVAIIFLGAHLLSFSVWRDVAHRIRGHRFCRKTVVRATVLALFLAGPPVLLAFYPPTHYDATLYHLPYATAFVESAGVPFLEDIRYPVFPQLQDLLFALGFLMSGEVLAHLTQTTALLLTTLFLVAWGRTLKQPHVGWWAGALWLGNPIAVWLGASAYIDIGLTLFVTAGLLAWHLWSTTRNHQWLVISGSMVGFAGASKYPGLFFVGVVGSAILAYGLHHRRWKPVFQFSVPAAVVAGPWYLRNLLLTGNPMFPFYSSIFGKSEWTRLPSPSSATDGASLFDQILSLFSRVADFCLVPYTAVFDRAQFNWEAPISPWYLVLIPLLAWPAFLTPIGRKIGLIVGAYGLFWLTTIPYIRFLIPILPIVGLALAAGAGFLWNTQRIPQRRRASTAAVIALCLLAPGWLYACVKIADFGPPPTTFEERSTFLSKRITGFDSVTQLNARLGSGPTIYALFCGNIRHFAEGRVIDDRPHTQRFNRVYQNLRKPAALRRELSNLGADHLLIVPKGKPIAIDTAAYAAAGLKVRRHDDHILVELTR